MEAPVRVRGMRRRREPRGQPHFVLPPNSAWDLRWGDFSVSNFHPTLIPGNLDENSFGVKEVAGAEVGWLVLGYLLGKNFRRNDDACGGERAADPLHCPGIDSELFGNATHTGPPGPARAYPNSLRHLRSSLPRRYHPADSNCERIRSEHFLDFMKQRHSPLLRGGPSV